VNHCSLYCRFTVLKAISHSWCWNLFSTYSTYQTFLRFLSIQYIQNSAEIYISYSCKIIILWNPNVTFSSNTKSIPFRNLIVCIYTHMKLSTCPQRASISFIPNWTRVAIREETCDASSVVVSRARDTADAIRQRGTIFEFWKLIKQPMKGNFKRYVDQKML
jgi:hypothetical protein